MKILAFDTSSTTSTVALLNGGRTAYLEEVQTNQSQVIIPMINQILTDVGIQLMELDAIAFGSGPGSFTGIRIAVSVAQGLAYACNLPLISISSLAILAHAAYLEHQWQDLLVAIDARMNEIYWANYHIDSRGHIHLEGEEVVCAPAHIPLPSPGQYHAVGNGWTLYHDKLCQQLRYSPIAISPDVTTRAHALLELAKQKWIKKDFVSLDAANPVYLRNKVAQTIAERK